MLKVVNGENVFEKDTNNKNNGYPVLKMDWWIIVAYNKLFKNKE